MANSIFLWPGVSSTTGGGGASFAGAVTAGSAATGSFYAADGTAALPSYSFTSEPTLGFYRSSVNFITTGGSLQVGNLNVPNGGAIYWLSRAFMQSPADGTLTIATTGGTIGNRFKMDALPTVASGGGGTVAPSVTAGSTPLAGSVNVGTGVITSPIVINFNGTAFPSAPFAVCTDGQTAIAVRATASTTQLTLTSAAFVANDVIAWHCISAK